MNTRGLLKKKTTTWRCPRQERLARHFQLFRTRVGRSRPEPPQIEIDRAARIKERGGSDLLQPLNDLAGPGASPALRGRWLRGRIQSADHDLASRISFPFAEGENRLINPLGGLMLRRACMGTRARGPTTPALGQTCRRCSFGSASAVVVMDAMKAIRIARPGG